MNKRPDDTAGQISRHKGVRPVKAGNRTGRRSSFALLHVLLEPDQLLVAGVVFGLDDVVYRLTGNPRLSRYSSDTLRRQPITNNLNI
jgi:hypothetical protein